MDLLRVGLIQLGDAQVAHTYSDLSEYTAELLRSPCGTMAESPERHSTLSPSCMHSAMDLVTRSIPEIRSVLEMTGRRVALGRTIGGSLTSSSETRRTMELCVVRSNLTLVELPLSVLKGLVGGFRGIVVSGTGNY